MSKGSRENISKNETEHRHGLTSSFYASVWTTRPKARVPPVSVAKPTRKRLTSATTARTGLALTTRGERQRRLCRSCARPVYCYTRSLLLLLLCYNTVACALLLRAHVNTRYRVMAAGRWAYRAGRVSKVRSAAYAWKAVIAPAPRAVVFRSPPRANKTARVRHGGPVPFKTPLPKLLNARNSPSLFLVPYTESFQTWSPAK